MNQSCFIFDGYCTYPKVVSRLQGLPLSCTVVPVCTTESFYLTIFMGTVHDLKRWV